jgi:hypothetical protein
MAENHSHSIISVYHLMLYSSHYSDGLQDEQPGFDSWQEQKIFLYSTASKSSLGPTQSPIEWEPGHPSLEINQFSWPGAQLSTGVTFTLYSELLLNKS